MPAKRQPTSILIKYLTGGLAMLSPMLGLALEIGAPSTTPFLGESLRLEIPLSIPAGTKVPNSSCARLVPRPDDSEEDYFPKEMRATIEARRGGAMLIVTSTKGVASPVVGFRVLMGCDAGVSRDFMLLSSVREITKPATQAATGSEQASSAAAETKQNRATQGHEMVLSRNTTLNKLARGRYPGNRETRDEYRRLMAEANPELFANADQVGSVPLPAGTVLKVPADLPKSEAKTRKDAPTEASAELPQAVEGSKAGSVTKDAEAQPPRTPAVDERTPRAAHKKADRLVVGGGQKEGRVPSLSQQELKQTLERLEQMVGDKSRNDIAMSETLTSLAASFGEVKTYLQGVDERVKRAEAEQVRAQAELQTLREELRSSFSLIELLVAIVGGGAIGAGLIVAFQRLTMRRAPVPVGDHTTFDSGVATTQGSSTVAAGALTTHPAYAVAQPNKIAEAQPAETPAGPSSVRGTRLEPTAKNMIERAGALAPNASPEAIPAKFGAIKKAATPQGNAQTESRTQPGSSGQTPPKVQDSHVEISTPETKFELELPKTSTEETSPSATNREAAATIAAASQSGSGLELSAPKSTSETELELALGSDQTQLAESEGPDSTIDPVLELADVMTSLGLAKEAASAVVEHIRQHPHQDPLHWFKVLEIYRSTGHREGFDEAVQELRQKLNVSIDDWDADPTKVEKTSLEDYPHLIKEVQALWPKPECEAYLTTLLEDNRGGKRAGFPQAVAEEIVLLKAILRNAPLINFPPINVSSTGEDAPDLSESKAWREFRMIP